MIITDEKRAALKKAYKLIKKNYKFGDVTRECNISRTETEALRLGIYYRIKMDVLMSRMLQIQENMMSTEIEILIKDSKK